MIWPLYNSFQEPWWKWPVENLSRTISIWVSNFKIFESDVFESDSRTTSGTVEIHFWRKFFRTETEMEPLDSMRLNARPRSPQGDAFRNISTGCHDHSLVGFRFHFPVNNTEQDRNHIHMDIEFQEFWSFLLTRGQNRSRMTRLLPNWYWEAQRRRFRWLQSLIIPVIKPQKGVVMEKHLGYTKKTIRSSLPLLLSMSGVKSELEKSLGQAIKLRIRNTFNQDLEKYLWNNKLRYMNTSKFWIEGYPHSRFNSLSN